MNMTVEPGGESPDLAAFDRLVWPPNLKSENPLAHIVWNTAYERRLITRDDGGQILSQIALLSCAARLNGAPARIGGIAGVGTHPAFRGYGLASAGLKQAAELLATEAVDFAALFCAPAIVPFYEPLGWRSFDGSVHVRQPAQSRILFGYCMTLPLRINATGGDLDIDGLPW